MLAMSGTATLPFSGAALWFGCWCTGGVVVTLGFLQQQALPGNRWPTDSHVLGTPNYFRRRLPLALSVATLPLVHFLPRDDVTFRCVVSLASYFYALKTYEVITEDRFATEPLFYRVAGVIGTFHDVQDRQEAHPWVGPRLLQIVRHSFKLAWHAAGAFMSAWVLGKRHELGALVANSLVSSQLAATMLACVSGCVYSFFSLHCYGDTLTVLWLLVPGGFLLPPLMTEPERALSVRQFWSRWDVVIQKLLRRHVFDPLRKAGFSSHVAMAATFVCSGWVHVWPIFVGLNDDFVAAASMMSYFLSQLIIIYAERPLGVERWDSTNALAWTLVCLFAPSYLLVTPVFKLLQMPF